MNEDALDFGGVTATAAVQVYPAWAITGAVGTAVLALIAMIAVSSWLVLRRDPRTERAGALRLGALPPSQKLLCGLVLMSLLGAQAVAVADAYAQTRVVHASAGEYFAYLSYFRLLGTSHSHLAAFGLVYGVLGLLVSMSDCRESTKCILIASLLWAGVFDVLSWWGIKRISAHFEWLSMAAGIVIGGGSLLATYLIARSLSGRTDSVHRPAEGTLGAAAESRRTA